MPIRIRGVEELVNELPRFHEKIQTAARKVQHTVAKQLFVGIVVRTPVDKGFAMASWRMNTGSQLTSTAPPGDYKLRSSRGQISRSAARSKAVGYAKEQLNNLKLRPDLPTVYITNSVPYIGRLEGSDGGSPTSPQAPAGMVRVSVAALIEKFRALAN